jgi:ribonuclease R
MPNRSPSTSRRPSGTPADAERDSKEVKLYAYLEAQLKSKRPQPYAALVTDVRNFGFFVDVTDLGISGVVPLSAIPDDFFIFEPASGRLVGRHTRRIIQLGDRSTCRSTRSIDSRSRSISRS